MIGQYKTEGTTRISPVSITSFTMCNPSTDSVSTLYRPTKSLAEKVIAARRNKLHDQFLCGKLDLDSFLTRTNFNLKIELMYLEIRGEKSECTYKEDLEKKEIKRDLRPRPSHFKRLALETLADRREKMVEQYVRKAMDKETLVRKLYLNYKIDKCYRRGRGNAVEKEEMREVEVNNLAEDFKLNCNIDTLRAVRNLNNDPTPACLDSMTDTVVASQKDFPPTRSLLLPSFEEKVINVRMKKIINSFLCRRKIDRESYDRQFNLNFKIQDIYRQIREEKREENQDSSLPNKGNDEVNYNSSLFNDSFDEAESTFNLGFLEPPHSEY